MDVVSASVCVSSMDRTGIFMHVYVPESTWADSSIDVEIFVSLKCPDLFIVHRVYDQSAWRLPTTRSPHVPRTLLVSLSTCGCGAEALSKYQVSMRMYSFRSVRIIAAAQLTARFVIS